MRPHAAATGRAKVLGLRSRPIGRGIPPTPSRQINTAAQNVSIDQTFPTMPSVAVEVDSTLLATVRCDEFHVVTVRVSSTLIEETFATLEVTASTHPEAGESTYLMWVHDYALEPGQAISVRLMVEGATTGKGKTIDDLYPDEGSRDQKEPKSEAECFEELRATPKLRAGYTFTLNSPAHPSYTGATQPDEHGFSFNLLWNWLRPNRAAVFLSSYTINSVENRTPGREHSHEYIHAGQSATLRVDA